MSLVARRASRLSINTVTRLINNPDLKGKSVGEVRTIVRLTHPSDFALASKDKVRRKVRSCVAEALVDTGTVRLAITKDIVKKLGLKILTRRLIELADGSYHTIPISQPVIVELEGLTTSEEAAVMGNEVLIGQSILESLDLFVDCKRNRLVPNPLHPDGPVMKAK
jgi:clan AA aspartic protease